MDSGNCKKNNGDVLFTATRTTGKIISRKRSPLIRWVVEPAASFRLLLIPLVLHITWEVLSRLIPLGTCNPFSGFFKLSGYITTSSLTHPLYRKTWWDLAFLAYYIVFFAFFRATLASRVSRPTARYFGVRRQKMDRFCEQLYSVVYFSVFGVWGCYVMTQLPTTGFKTEEFWSAYPQWAIIPGLKRYYLMQFAYWVDQSLVMLLGLEKSRKDYWAMVIHHPVTIWLVGMSYLLNYTYAGNAVFLSMDIPDAFLSFSQLLNTMQWNTAKVYSFTIFYVVWGYFRHYLSILVLWSVWYEMPVKLPQSTKEWNWSKGVYGPNWMRDQIFLALAALQLLNIYWYYLMTRILIRGFITRQVEDARSDDEDEGDVGEKKH